MGQARAFTKDGADGRNVVRCKRKPCCYLLEVIRSVACARAHVEQRGEGGGGLSAPYIRGPHVQGAGVLQRACTLAQQGIVKRGELT